MTTIAAVMPQLQAVPLRSGHLESWRMSFYIQGGKQTIKEWSRATRIANVNIDSFIQLHLA